MMAEVELNTQASNFTPAHDEIRDFIETRLE
jgi:hypothetical protein